VKNEFNMKPSKIDSTRTVRRIFISLSTALLFAAAGCSSSAPAVKTDPAKAAQGGTASADAQKKFVEAVEIYQKQGDAGIGSAISKLEDAVGTDPAFGKAWFNLGVLYEKQGKKEDAANAYTKASQASKKLGDSFVNLGMMALDAGKPDEARRLFEQALEAESYNAAAHNNLSVFFREDKDYPGAVRHARLSLAGDASNIEAYSNLARIYYRRGNFDVAKLVILNALKMPDGPNNPDLHNILGLVELERNDVTEGIRQFEKAVELAPEHVPALLNLGAVVLNVRDYPRALKLFEKVLALEPDSITAEISVAVAKRGMGDLAAADSIYQDILKRDPENAIVQYNLGVLEHEHKAQQAMVGTDREPPKPAASESPSDQMLASADQMEWTIANIKGAVDHYQASIEHYRSFLAYDKSGNQERREEANKRIGQVSELIGATREQIPGLESAAAELRQQAQEFARDEAAAREAEAAEEAQSGEAGPESAPEEANAGGGV